MTIREELELVKKELLKWTDVQLNLKNRMDELEAKLEEEQEQDWPQAGDLYYFIDDLAYVECGTYFDEPYSDAFYDCERESIGNMFRTKEEAEFEVERLKVIAELKKFARPFKVGIPNWTLIYDHNKRKVSVGGLIQIQYNSLYFESIEKAEKAIQAVGEDRIKKYYFGGGGLDD